MSTQVRLDERLMKAADALLHHGECLEVIHTTADGTRRVCRLRGRGERAGTVVLSIWTMFGPRYANRDIHYAECTLPIDMALRLEAVALEQESAGEGKRTTKAPREISPEMARTLEFIQRQHQRRRRPSGQFAGYHCEPAGRR